MRSPAAHRGVLRSAARHGERDQEVLLEGAALHVAQCAAELAEGIGDTIRVSLAADPVEEVRIGADMVTKLAGQVALELVAVLGGAALQRRGLPRGEILGAHIMGDQATELIAEMGLDVDPERRGAKRDRAARRDLPAPLR